MYRFKNILQSYDSCLSPPPIPSMWDINHNATNGQITNKFIGSDNRMMVTRGEVGCGKGEEGKMGQI